VTDVVCAALPKWRISFITRLKPSAPGERKWYANWAGRREVVCLEGVAAGKEIGSACERVFWGTTIMGDEAVTYWKHGASPSTIGKDGRNSAQRAAETVATSRPRVGVI
jgi:hypothetical protein